MFMAKFKAAGLKTVSDDADVRNVEFKATRLIQEYMMHQAEENSVPIVKLKDYDQAFEEIRVVLLDKIGSMLSGEPGGRVE